MPEYVMGVRAHDYGKGDVQEIFCNIKKDGWHCTQFTTVPGRKKIASHKGT